MRRLLWWRLAHGPAKRIPPSALGTRIAIYTYAACSALLGFLTLVGTGPRRHIENEEDEVAYTDKVVQHIKDVDQCVMASTLTGIALMVAAVTQENLLHTFTQYHAYVVLMLLWVITLTGMWFVIHAWVSTVPPSAVRLAETSVVC